MKENITDGKKINWKIANILACIGICIGLTFSGILYFHHSQSGKQTIPKKSSVIPTPTVFVSHSNSSDVIDYGSSVPAHYTASQGTTSITPVPQQNTNRQGNANDPIINCVKSWGSFLDTKSDCDSTPDTPHSQTNFQPNTAAPTTSAPQQQQAPQNNNDQLYAQCVSNAQNAGNQQAQSCINQYGGSGTAEACQQIVRQNEQQSLNQCSSTYPH